MADTPSQETPNQIQTTVPSTPVPANLLLDVNLISDTEGLSRDVELFHKRLNAVEITSKTGAGGDASTLNGLAGSASPTANKYLALDANTRFPFSTLYADKGTTTFGAATSKYVSTGVVSTNSRIFLTPQASPAGVNFWIVEKNQGTSFRISADAANSIAFDWFLWG